MMDARAITLQFTSGGTLFLVCGRRQDVFQTTSESSEDWRGVFVFPSVVLRQTLYKTGGCSLSDSYFPCRLSTALSGIAAYADFILVLINKSKDEWKVFDLFFGIRTVDEYC